MSAARKLLGSGVPAQAANYIGGDVQTGFAAAGTTQTNAALLQYDNTEVTTVGSGSGVIANSNNQVGDDFIVSNAQGTNALLVYAEVGSSINALSTTSGFSIPANKSALFWKAKSTKYYVILSA